MSGELFPEILTKFDNKISALEKQQTKLRTEARNIETAPRDPGPFAKYRNPAPGAYKDATMEKRGRVVDKQLEKISSQIAQKKVAKIPYEKYLRKF